MNGRTQEYAKELLRIEMSEISEDHYAAGWMSNLEYELWEIVLKGGGEYGMGVVDPEMVSRLKQFAADAGGWWTHERFVPMDEWHVMYAEKMGGGS